MLPVEILALVYYKHRCEGKLTYFVLTKAHESSRSWQLHLGVISVPDLPSSVVTVKYTVNKKKINWQ